MTDALQDYLDSGTGSILRVVVDQHFLEVDGRVYTDIAYDYTYWRQFLGIFERVEVICRVRTGSQTPPGWVRAEGPGVKVIPLPEYLGFWRLLRRLPDTFRRIGEALRRPGPVLLRMGHLSLVAWAWLMMRRRPYALDLVGRPDVGVRGLKNIQVLGLNRLLARLSEWAIRQMALGASCASYVAQTLRNAYPTRRRPHETVVPSVILPEDRFAAPRPSERFAHTPRRLVSIGRLEPEKGHHVLLSALALLQSQGLTDLRLDLAGPGSRLEGLRKQASELGLSRSVRFLGHVSPREGVRALLEQADLFVLPSLTEGMPRALLEAMAMAVPCVASAVGGVPEVLGPELLAKPGEPADLADRIRQALSCPRRLATISSELRQRAEAFAQDRLARRRREYWRQVRELTGARGQTVPAWPAESKVGGGKRGKAGPQRPGAVRVVVEQHFLEVGGRIYADLAYDYTFWREFLDVFERVEPVARVRHAQAAPQGFLRADGPGVHFRPVREYLGFWQFLRHLPRVLYDTFLATREPGPILLRMGNISNCCWLWLLLRRRPYAVDILGRAGMGPRHVKNVQILGLNRLLGWLGELLVRTQVRLARCANYVAGYQQQLYPTGSRQHEFVVTDVILPKEAFAKPRPLERFAGQPYRILAIGRVEPEKGHQFLVEAAAELRRRGLDNFVLDIVGPGSQLEPMRQRASQLGLDGRVRFPGRVAMGDPVRQLLDQADLFVLPSLTEGMPRALLEAIARSVPAIGTAAGGTAEVLPAELLVPPSDAKALADKMAEVLHPERLAAMSALSWQLVRKFDPAVILEQRRQFWRVVGRLCSPTAV